MRIVDMIMKKLDEAKELEEMERVNARRRADINSAISIAGVGEETAPDPGTRSRHSKFKARAEAIKDRLDQADHAIRQGNIERARELDSMISAAIDDLAAV